MELMILPYRWHRRIERAFFKKRERAEPEQAEKETEEVKSAEDLLLRSSLGADIVTRETAEEIPALEGNIDLIVKTAANVPIKLYRKNGKRVEEVEDNRVKLLNEDTGDTMDAKQMKQAMFRDYYLGRGGFCYVNKNGLNVKSLHYVDQRNIGFAKGPDVIFKQYVILVQGKSYFPEDFIKLLRNTNDGVRGHSLIETNKTLLSIMYNNMKFEESLVRTGGNKKGFIKSPRTLTQAALDSIKAAFRRLYQNNTENVVVLNNGLEFQESSNTSVEMQMNENKQTNSNECCKMLGIPSSMLNGGGNEEDDKKFIKYCVTNLLDEFTTAINKVLLLESEKDQYYFAADLYELTKGDIEKRYNAYKQASDTGWLQTDEIRERENMEPLGMNMVKLGLQDVLYDPKSKMLYVPNTNQMHKLGEGGNAEGKSKSEQGETGRNQSQLRAM